MFKIKGPGYLPLFLAAGLLLSSFASSAEAGTPTASSPVQAAALAAPNLNCGKSGELFGVHPGWLNEAAKKLKIVPVSSGTYAAYWCPASAPNGQGVISYTLTSSLAGGTCEVTATHCVLPLYSTTATYALMATDRTGNYFLGTDVATQNPGTPIACSPGYGSCDNKYQNLTFSAYGNMTGTNDCSLAAMANWGSLNLGVTAGEAELLADWQRLSPNNLGVNNTQALNFWKGNGISGVYLQNAQSIYIDPATLKSTLDNNKAVIGSLVFNAGQNFAGVEFSNYTQHWVLVDGYTPAGPLVVSWGRTLQMTWQQWNLEADVAYKITAKITTQLTPNVGKSS